MSRDRAGIYLVMSASTLACCLLPAGSCVPHELRAAAHGLHGAVPAVPGLALSDGILRIVSRVTQGWGRGRPAVLMPEGAQCIVILWGCAQNALLEINI